MSNDDEKEDISVKDGEEVDQVGGPEQDPVIAPLPLVQATEPILVPSSNSDAVDDFGLSEVHHAAEHICEHFFNQGGSLNYNLEEEEVDMAPRAKALGKQKAV